MAQSMQTTRSYKGAYDLRQALNGIKTKGATAQAVLIGLSGLKDDFARHRFVHLAADIFHPLRLAAPGNVEIFVPESLDIIVIGKALPRTEIRDAALQVGAMFAADPLLDGGGAEGLAKVARWFDFSKPDHLRDFEQAVSDISDRSVDAARRRVSGEVEDQPLTPKRLFLVQQDAPDLALGPMMGREAIIGLGRDGLVRKVAEDIQLEIAKFRKAVDDDIDFISDPWLAMDLFRVLGPLMLPVIAHVSLCAAHQGVSIHSSIETIESEAFRIFRDQLQTAERLFVTLDPIDAFADMAKAHKIRDYLSQNNCISVLGPFTPQGLMLADPGVVGADLIRISWSPELDSGIDSGLGQLMNNLGRDRIILENCVGPEALAWGSREGLRYFQGPHVDRVIGTPSRQICAIPETCGPGSCPMVPVKSERR